MGSTDNVVEGNYIGTDAAGTAALGNAADGVYIGSDGNTVGGLTSTPGMGAGNVISGNLNRGVAVEQANSNLIEGNLIGTNASGTAALGNANQGVSLDGGTANTVGGIAAGASNIISANGGGGILISFGATQMVVQGNYIGTDITGTAAIGNTLNGIDLFGASNNTIGGTTAAARNVISGNNANGVYIANAVNFFGFTGASSGNLVAGNYIGTDAAGTAALGDQSGGVFLVDAANNLIGGPASGQGNTISFNTGAGVVVTGSTSTGDAIRGNLIYSNTGLGIDLGDTGTIPGNDSKGHSGPNNSPITRSSRPSPPGRPRWLAAH